MTRKVVTGDNFNFDAGTRLNVVSLSICTMNSCNFTSSCKDLGWVEAFIRASYADSESLEKDEAAFILFQDLVREADYLVIDTHGDPDHFEKFGRLLSVIESNHVPTLVNSASPEVNARFLRLSGFGEEDTKRLRRYVMLGGRKNNIGLLLCLCRLSKGMAVNVPEPYNPVCQGIYMPGAGTVKDERGYLSSIDHARPTVAVMFHQGMWVDDNTGPIDCLISSLESKGASVIPIFFRASPDPDIGSIGVVGTIKKYLMSKRKGIVDAVIMVGGFSQNASSGIKGMDSMTRNVFDLLDVPVIQANIFMMNVQEWLEQGRSLSPSSISFSVFQPEFDGQIISVPLCFSEPNASGIYRSTYVPDRVDRISSLAFNWATLHRKGPGDIRVAFLLNYDGSSIGRMGLASGLDTFESLLRILKKLSREGFSVGDVPKSAESIAKRLCIGLNNSEGGNTGGPSWKPVGTVSLRQYSDWFMELPEVRQSEMNRLWGRPLGDFTFPDKYITIPGLAEGNMFIGMEPGIRSGQDDGCTVPSHQYYAFYKWIREVFRADVLVHVGSHGSLEFLPGRDVALTSGCWPDILMGAMPNLYLYIVDNPGEAMYAKRRTSSVIIGHLEPPVSKAGTSGSMSDLELVIQGYMRAHVTCQTEKISELGSRMCQMVRGLGIDQDLGMASGTDADLLANISGIYSYIREVKYAEIPNGYHVVGQLPKGRELAEKLYAYLSNDVCGRMPLIEAYSAARGYDSDRLRSDPAGSTEGRTNAELYDELYEGAVSLLEEIIDKRFDPGECLPLCMGHGPLLEDVDYLCRELYPALTTVDNELTMLVHGIRGGFVRPGPSGTTAFGNLRVLPTGRNFCSIDPGNIPNELSWKVGSDMAEDTIGRFVNENGRYPETVAVVLNVTDLMMNEGDGVAYILRLLGTEPEWAADGHVAGLRVIPLSVLGRPRIDVLVRVSPLMVNTFPLIIRLVNDALDMVARLDEDSESNILRRHLAHDLESEILSGMDKEDRYRHSLLRVFVNPPVHPETDYKWTDRNGREVRVSEIDSVSASGDGCDSTRLYLERMRDIDLVTVGRRGLFTDGRRDVDDLNRDLGLFSARSPAVEVKDADRTRSYAAELAFEFRTKILSQNWFDGLKKHGFTGAGELSQRIHDLLDSGTKAGCARDWMYRGIAEAYVFNRRNRNWLMDRNPHALRDITEELFSAMDAGAWNPQSEEVLGLREIYLEVEGAIEDIF